ncbi:MAG: SDR family NAD(P)-dependent oxidoreductase [Pseudomonadota bacterium]
MTTRSILITGCSSGIGLDAARTLHTRGWQVIATCRADDDVARLKGEGLTALRLDYEDDASIIQAVTDTLSITDGRLDAVFNNGAYAVVGPLEDIPTAALRANFEANFLGWHTLTRALIPVFRAQGAGRIVQCSSVLGFQAMRHRGSYNATKFALEGYSDTLRLEMRGTGIHVVLIEPGPIRTEFRRNAVKQFEKWVDWEKSLLRSYYEDRLLAALRKSAEATKPDPFELGPEAVTEKLIHAIEAPTPQSRYFVTRPTWIAAIAKRVLPVVAQDAIFGRIE